MADEQLYVGEGVSFRYPGHWQLAEETGDESTTVTVSDGGAFWSVTLLSGRPPIEDVLRQALDAFRDEYEEVDVEERESSLAGRPGRACDLEFVCLELINCVFLRAVRSGRHTLFVMAQVTDHERETYQPAFENINRSLDCDLDDRIID